MIQVNRIYLIFNRLVTKKFLVDTSGLNQEKAGREIRLFAFILYCLSGCNSHSFLYYP